MRSIQRINTERLVDDWKFEFCTTINENGTPHIVLINSMFLLESGMAAWGQTCHGIGKANFNARKLIAFMTYEGEVVLTFGHAKLHHSESGGPLMDLFNHIPRYRYNTISGFSPVHVMTLLDLSPEERLSDFSQEREASRRIAGAIYPGNDYRALSCWTRKYFECPKSFKVIGWIDEKGMPQIAPLPQCEITPANRAVFTLNLYRERLSGIKANTPVAIYAIDFDKCQTVMVEGKVSYTEQGGVPFGIVDIDAVYNPMLPRNCYVYPREPLKPIADWGVTAPGFNV